MLLSKEMPQTSNKLQMQTLLFRNCILARSLMEKSVKKGGTIGAASIGVRNGPQMKSI
jgi:hypothetical protein